MSDLVIVAIGVVIFAGLTVTILLFGYLQMAHAYERDEEASPAVNPTEASSTGVEVHAGA